MIGVSARYLTTLAFVGLTVTVYAISERRRPDFLVAPLESLPMELDGWRSIRDNFFTAGVLRQLKPTSYISRTYGKNGSELDLFVAFYAEQRGGESMHSPKHCLPGAGWEIWKHDSAGILFNGTEVRINKYSINNAGRRMLVYYWYQSEQRIIASEYVAKILLVRDRLIDGRTGGSIVRIVVPDTEAAAAGAERFAAGIMPHVQSSIGTAE